MNKQEERERQIINLISKLPSKKFMIKLFYSSVFLFVIYFNYSMFNAQVFKTISFIDFMGMNRTEAEAFNIPRYYIALSALLFLVDIISLIIISFIIGPTIGRVIKSIWNKFPD